MNKKTSNWKQLANTTDLDVCKDSCEADASDVWQWAVHDNDECHCLKYVEHGMSIATQKNRVVLYSRYQVKCDQVIF